MVIKKKTHKQKTSAALLTVSAFQLSFSQSGRMHGIWIDNKDVDCCCDFLFFSKNFLRDLSSFYCGQHYGEFSSRPRFGCSSAAFWCSAQRTAFQSRAKNKLCCSVRLHCHGLKVESELFFSHLSECQYAICLFLFISPHMNSFLIYDRSLFLFIYFFKLMISDINRWHVSKMNENLPPYLPFAEMKTSCCSMTV